MAVPKIMEAVLTDHKLLPKHGETFTVLENKAVPQAQHIIALQQRASYDLVNLLQTARSDGKRVAFPCRQCIFDAALLFHDLSEALKELAESK